MCVRTHCRLADSVRKNKCLRKYSVATYYIIRMNKGMQDKQHQPGQQLSQKEKGVSLGGTKTNDTLLPTSTLCST